MPDKCQSMPRTKFFIAAAIACVLAALSCSEPIPQRVPVRRWDKAAWIREAVSAVGSGRYPRIRALSWWHERWQNGNLTWSDLRINSSPDSLAAYRESTADPVFITAPSFASGKLTLPASPDIYLAAFPFFGNEEDVVTAERITEFEALAGRPITWAYFSDNWIGGISFPSANVQTIIAAGRVPFIRMMMRSTFDGPPDPVYSLQDILDGDYDAQLSQWATDAKNCGSPLLVEFGTEVNGEWFPWNGRWNGGGSTVGYGDPALADGPERFRDAFRHIRTLCDDAGAANITWFYHVNYDSWPEESWNDMAAYYPGDDWVDWIGISVYGPQTPMEQYQNFVDLMDAAYPDLEAISATKPLAILEIGIAEAGILFPEK
jgi:hypothetical protein